MSKKQFDVYETKEKGRVLQDVSFLFSYPQKI